MLQDYKAEPLSDELKDKIDNFIKNNSISLITTKKLLNELKNFTYHQTEGRKESFNMILDELNQVYHKLVKLDELLEVFKEGTVVPYDIKNKVF